MLVSRENGGGGAIVQVDRVCFCVYGFVLVVFRRALARASGNLFSLVGLSNPPRLLLPRLQ